MSNINRKLASVRRISAVTPIEDADLIELVRIDGWQCVAKKGEFAAGDLCVYFEIDSFLPVRPEFEFLRKTSFQKMGDKEGFRIKTVKIRNQLSQGLALPVSILGKNVPVQGADVTEMLGVLKWDPPVPAQLAGTAKGFFPGFIPRTDQERCQNLEQEIFVDNINSFYEVTIKLDGSSATFYHRDGDIGVCSRNLELKINDENANNSLVRMLLDSGLATVLPRFGNIAVQGELMGPGIQKNREGLSATHFYIFDIFMIDEQRYATPDERRELVDRILDQGVLNVNHVPIVESQANLLETFGIDNIGALLKFAEGKSINHPVREGLVFKRMDGKFSFKAISNDYLLKNKE